METIKSLEKISLNSLFVAFSEAFKDYEMPLNKEELRIMLKRRGFVPRLSFGSFENDKIIKLRQMSNLVCLFQKVFKKFNKSRKANIISKFSLYLCKNLQYE